MDRYDLCLGYNHDGSPYATAEISPYNDGEWVKYSDVEPLQARVKELERVVSMCGQCLGNPIIQPKYHAMDAYKACLRVLGIDKKIGDQSLKGPHDER